MSGQGYVRSKAPYSRDGKQEQLSMKMDSDEDWVGHRVTIRIGMIVPSPVADREKAWM